MAEISWAWDFVPVTEADREGWPEFMANLLDEWAGDQVDAARAAWPADAVESFPFPPGAMGTAVAHDLMKRADDAPPGCRLVWGAGFVDDKVRWMPLMALVEFRQPRPGDSSYLMSLVSAEGHPDDVRPPVVEYFSTDRGDGVRVTALADNHAEGPHGRVHAALRLELPDGDVDVLVETRVGGMEQLAVIGGGIEVIMNLIAERAPGMSFVTAGKGPS